MAAPKLLEVLSTEQRVEWYDARVECMRKYIESMDNGSYKPRGDGISPMSRDDAEKLLRKCILAAEHERHEMPARKLNAPVVLPVHIINSVLSRWSGNDDITEALKTARDTAIGRA